MWHRRIPHHSAGETFSLNQHELEFKARVADVIEPLLRRSVDDLQEIFRELPRFSALGAHPAIAPFRSVVEEQEEILAALWNYTCRDDLGGRRPIEAYLREMVRAGEPDPEEDYGTGHVHCAHTGELLANPDFFGPSFFAFVEGRDLHGLDMAPPHSRFPRPDGP